MDKKKLVEDIASNTYCSLNNFRDICIHELKHMGFNPAEFYTEIDRFIKARKYDKRRMADSQ